VKGKIVAGWWVVGRWSLDLEQKGLVAEFDTNVADAGVPLNQILLAMVSGENGSI